MRLLVASLLLVESLGQPVVVENKAGASGTLPLIMAVNVSLWYGLLAPADTPRCVVAQGAEPMRGTPEMFAGFMRQEMAKWAPVVKAAKVKAE